MTKWVEVKIQYKEVMFLCSMVFLLTILCIPAWSETEVPLNLPKVEGSKSFDLDLRSNCLIEFLVRTSA